MNTMNTEMLSTEAKQRLFNKMAKYVTHFHASNAKANNCPKLPKGGLHERARTA